MTRDEIAQLFARRQEAWDRRDSAALAADHAETCVVISPTAGTVAGRSNIERVYKSWFSAFPDLEFKGEDLLIEEGRAALVWKVVGTHAGDFLGFPATGRRFEVSGIFLYDFDGERITQERRFFDFTGVLVQIGILKAKPASQP